MNSFVFTARSRGYSSHVPWSSSVEPPQFHPWRSSWGTEFVFSSISCIDPCIDPDIELTLRRLRKVRSTIVSTNNSPNSSSNFDNNVSVTNHTDFSSYSSSNSNTYSNLDLTNSNKPELMENQDRTLKVLATPDVVYQPWCIEYSQLELIQSYELKSGLVHLLPKFHGLVGEDPYKHMKEFYVVCSTMRLQGIPEDYIKMKAFPFSLNGAAKD
ncbi:hypothetical protein CR513_14536, partial [Mucuna pruriens]